MKSKGLGDSVEKVFKATGIKKMAKKYTAKKKCRGIHSKNNKPAKKYRGQGRKR
jgi:hypothetical protein